MNNLYRILRFTAVLAVMIFVGGGSTAWGQPGIWYIANDNSTSGHPGNAYSSATEAERYYLVPAANPQQTPSCIDAYYSPNHNNTNGNPGKPFLATYQTNKDFNSVWVVVESGEENYYFVIHVPSGKYVIYEVPLPNDPNTNSDTDETKNGKRKTMHLQTPDDGNYSLSSNDNYKFAITTSGSGYKIQPKNRAGWYWNPAGQNSPNYYGISSPLYQNGLVGVFTGEDKNSIWHFEDATLPAPIISNVSATNTITITDANGLPEGYTTIRYTTDGSDPRTSDVYSEYSGPIEVTSSMTVKAVVVGYGIVLTSLAEKTVSPVAVAAPTITNNYDGTISLSTTTPGATIYYTTNGNDPDNTSTPYSSSFSLGDATIIKAIAYVGEEYSDVTTYNVPKYTTPTISFNDNTSLITITSEGTVYYNTGDGSQDDPTPSSGTPYSEPFTVSSDITVKAIATHAGYLNSDVATWSAIRGYLTFNVLTDGTICWKAFGDLTKTISYRINGGSWTDITSTSAGATINVYEDDVVEFKGANETYATSKSAYSGFEGGTATFDIEGNIHSLLYGDDFANNTALTNSTYQFCSLFKKAPVISAENLVLPATTLKDYCYRALFSWCETLEEAPALPATTLATGCYWYMFEQCAISSAPELNATTLVKECYGHMFENCPNLNYIKCVATSGFDKSNCLLNWVLGVPSPGTFVNEPIPAWTLGASGIPSGWTYNAYLFSPEISCDGVSITITCATEEADIYYRLNQTGNFSLYSSPIVVNSTTTVEAYSYKGDIISNTVIYTFEIFDNPFDESTRSINSWTYANAQVTLPYSVNGIDGHSSSYSQGTHAFETTITIYSLQPTYLWFQHADQSADIYVDNTFVTTHWGGYNAFFVDITDYVQIGTNKIKVILNNKTRNALAPCAGDFNFNATLGKVKLLTSPIMPDTTYGYDGFHITSSVSDASATINIKTLNSATL